MFAVSHVLLIFLFVASTSVMAFVRSARTMLTTQRFADIKYDSQGYVVKEKDWFNGLSLDPGARCGVFSICIAHRLLKHYFSST